MSVSLLPTIIGTIISVSISIFGVYGSAQEKISDLTHRVGTLEKTTDQIRIDHNERQKEIEKELKEIKEIAVDLRIQLSAFASVPAAKKTK